MFKIDEHVRDKRVCLYIGHDEEDRCGGSLEISLELKDSDRYRPPVVRRLSEVTLSSYLT